MNGGTITNNTGDGGGVLLQNSTMTMAGGVISGNTATESGAGIAMTGRVSFSMSGGEVSGNKQAEKTPYEAQVALRDDKVGATAFALSSGTISTEGKTENALVFHRGSATISGGTVNGTVATVGIGGPVALTISGGTINGRLSNKELPVSEMEFEEDCTISLKGGRFSDDTELDVLKGWLASDKTLTPMTKSGKIFYRTDSLSTSSCTCSGATKITSGTTISTDGSKYYVGNGWSLTNSYTLSGQIIVDADDVTLCLHNRNITSSSGAAIICKGKNLKIVNGSENRGTIKGATCAVQVMSGGSVTIGDNVHIDNATNLTTAPVVVEAGVSFTMAGGSISTNKFTASQTYAGGAILAAGDVMLNCGVISGNRLTVASGGFGSGAVTMTGGKLTMGKHVIISGNNSGGHGGGVALYNASAFDMVGGTISGNSTDNTGGGVAVAAADARFNMTGGTISDNKASRWGGGVAVRMDEFNLSSGTIKDNDLTNSVHEYGNQITVGLWGDSTIGKFTMTGGEIIDTQADTTAGLKTSTDVTVCAGEAVISGGSITGQVSTVGVPIGSAALTISGGTINGEVINAVPLPTNANVAEQDTPEEMEAMRKDTTITITGGEFYGAIVETEHDNRKSATNTIISGGKFANFGNDARETLGSFLDDTKGILSVTEISEGNLDYEVRCGLVYNGAYMDFGSSLDFGLNLVADVGDCTEVSGYTLSLTGADADVEPEILIKEIEGSKQLFVMARGIAAKEMRNDITFTLKKDGEVWFTKTTSVYDAANEFRAEERQAAAENGTEANDDYLAMLGNMIYYGTQAQRRFGYNLRTLLNKPDFAETSGGKAWTGGDVVVSDGDASKVRLSLSLKEQIELNFYIRDPQARISNVTFAGEEIPASDYTVVQATGENDGYTMISFREISITKAKEMAQFTVTLPNATTFDVSGGIASYVKLAQNDSTEAALVSALRNYVDSVYKVFSVVPEAPVAARVSVEEL